MASLGDEAARVLGRQEGGLQKSRSSTYSPSLLPRCWELLSYFLLCKLQSRPYCPDQAEGKLALFSFEVYFLVSLGSG